MPFNAGQANGAQVQEAKSKGDKWIQKQENSWANLDKYREDKV